MEKLEKLKEFSQRFQNLAKKLFNPKSSTLKSTVILVNPIYENFDENGNKIYENFDENGNKIIKMNKEQDGIYVITCEDSSGEEQSIRINLNKGENKLSIIQPINNNLLVEAIIENYEEILHQLKSSGSQLKIPKEVIEKINEIINRKIQDLEKELESIEGNKAWGPQERPKIEKINNSEESKLAERIKKLKQYLLDNQTNDIPPKSPRTSRP